MPADRETEGRVVGAAIVAHVPTMVLPEATRRELNGGAELSLVPGLHRMKAEQLDAVRPDTIVVFDAHWATTVEFVVSAQARRHGLYTSDELPRGMTQVPYDIPGDPELAALIADEVATAGSWMTPIDDPYLPIHYPTVNLLPFLQGDERWISVSTAQTAETDDFLLVGAALGRAVARSGRRVVLLASGAMSHTFWKLKELRDHEASDPVHIRTPEARAADLERLAWLEAGDHARVIDTMPAFLRFHPEAMFGHYLMMVGAIGGPDCTAPGQPYSAYENAIGTGQVHVWFGRPADGWTAQR
jgi:aromatic ring-opening dioxygenase catalytic subunit (LigB family)